MVILDKNRRPLMIYGKPKKSIEDIDFKVKRYIFEDKGRYYLRYITDFQKNRYIIFEYRLPPLLEKYRQIFKKTGISFLSTGFPHFLRNTEKR